MIRFVLDFYRSRFSLNSVSLFKPFIDFESSLLKYPRILADKLKLEILSHIAVNFVCSLGFMFMD